MLTYSFSLFWIFEHYQLFRKYFNYFERFIIYYFKAHKIQLRNKVIKDWYPPSWSVVIIVKEHGIIRLVFGWLALERVTLVLIYLNFRINNLLLPHNFYSGAKHNPLFSQKPFHFHCSISALWLWPDKHNTITRGLLSHLSYLAPRVDMIMDGLFIWTILQVIHL